MGYDAKVPNAARIELHVESWNDYPAGVARPSAALHAVAEKELERLRIAALRLARQERLADPRKWRHSLMHFVHPLWLGGLPVRENLAAVNGEQHTRLALFWGRFAGR